MKIDALLPSRYMVPWAIRRARLFRQMMTKAHEMKTYEAMRKLPTLTETTCDFIVLESTNGPLFARYLVAHPEEAIRLCYLDPYEQVAELLRIDDMLNGRTDANPLQR